MPTIRVLTLVELDDAAAIPDFPVARRISPSRMATFTTIAGVAFATITLSIVTVTTLIIQNATRTLDVSFNAGVSFITLQPNAVLTLLDISIASSQLVVRDSAQAQAAPYKALVAGS